MLGGVAKITFLILLLSRILESFFAMMNLFKNANALVQGVPLPLVDSGGAPLLGTSIVRNITTIIQELEKPYEPGEVSSDRTNGGGPNFFSNHHFIEPNRT